MTICSAVSAIRRLALVALTAGAAACSDTTGITPEPTMESVAGVYTGAEMQTTEGGVTIDWLAEGGFIRLELRSDGTTAGQMFIPDAGEDGGDFDADLAGEWSIRGGDVHLDHEADTFLRDLPLQVRRDRLEGSEEFSGVRVQAVLVREEA